MSVKKMIELYVKYELSEDTWNMMREMRYHDLISYDNWMKFYETCKDWVFSEDGDQIVDSYGKIYYFRDSQGYMVKVK